MLDLEIQSAIDRAVNELENKLKLEAAERRARKYDKYIERFAVFSMGLALGSSMTLLGMGIARLVS